MLVRKKPKPTKPPKLSQSGNPYPPGLEPVVIDYAPPGSRDGQQRLDEASMPRNEPGKLELADAYLYETCLPDVPPLKLWLAPRQPKDTDATYEAYRRGVERHAMQHALFLRICQQICTGIGNPRTCREGACRRTGECRARRDEDATWQPYMIYPPCVPLDLEIMETYRGEIAALMTELGWGW